MKFPIWQLTIDGMFMEIYACFNSAVIPRRNFMREKKMQM